MFDSLIKDSVDRISSLIHYYETEAKSIEKTSRDGMERHELGAMIDDYFAFISFASEEEKQDDVFLRVQEKITPFVEVIEISGTEEKRMVSYRFKSSEYAEIIGNVKEEKRLYSQYADMPFIHGSSTLMMLITRFEEFIQKYLEELYAAFPNKYLDGQQLTFSEISKGDIGEIKKNLILREVDAKMRESYKEWFKIYQSHGMSCKPFEDDLKVLEEIYARRNILVHNSGKVNSIYKKAIPDTNAKVGDVLAVDTPYMQNAFITVFRVIILMLIESAKLNSASKEEFFKDIFLVLFSFLKQEKYEICEPAYALLSSKEGVNAEIRLMSKVNQWICIIALHGISEIKKDIEAFDVSALNKSFFLAKEVLLERYESTSSLLSDLLRNDEFDAKDVEEWPLFTWYRLSEQYTQLRETFPEKFKIEKAEMEQEDCPRAGESGSELIGKNEPVCV